MRWLHKIGLALAGILVFAGFWMIGRDGRNQRRAESREQGHLARGSKDALKKAAKENARAQEHRERAADAARKGRETLDKIGVRDESIADIVGDWNTNRVR